MNLVAETEFDADSLASAVSALNAASDAVASTVADDSHTDEDTATAANALFSAEDNLALAMAGRSVVVLRDGRGVVDLVALGADDGDGRFRVVPPGDVAAI